MNNVADKLYNILGTKFDNTDIKTLDSSGKETTDMEEIEMFSFDFLVNSRNYGPVVILLSANENLEVYYGDNTSKSLDTDAKKKWENLIEHLSTFARTNRLGFSLKHTSDLKYDLSNITDITESYRNIFEGYYGTKKTSYSPQGKAKIIIKHSKAIGEDDKRFRNISSLFIENADGERFKLPFKKLAGARAMARHVTEGGNPYDLFGVHISEMVNDINTLGGFVRRSKMYEGNDEAMGMVETGRTHYNNMRKSLKRIAGVRGYGTYKESWEPSAITEQDTDTSAIRKLFTEKKVNPRTEEALPLLARLQKMAEAQDLNEKAPPGMEDWIKSNKAEFIDQYGEEKGLEVLYATAWKRHNANESIGAPRRDLDAREDWEKHPDEDDWGETEDDDYQWEKHPDEPDDIDEDSNKPSEVDVYNKIRNWDATALRGYARRISLPADAFTARSDNDTMIDEIMGFLFDDDWEMKLIKAGAFDESTVQAEPTTDNDMKEINEFEQWADKIVEGTWSFPDSPDTREEVKQFMATEQPLGIDAMNAKDALYDILGNDDLFAELADIAAKDPDADARPAVKNYIETMYRDLDQYADEDHPNIVELYKAIGGDAIYPHEMDEGFAQDLDADSPTELNASHNKDMDTYIQKEDVDADTYAESNVWNESEEKEKEKECKWCGNTFPEDKLKAHEETCDYVIPKDLTKEAVNESVDFDALMKRTNFLLKK